MITKKSLFLLCIFAIAFAVPFLHVQASTPAKTIKILLVPGHDDAVWGSQYGSRKEADMNLSIATKIYNLLKKDKRFEVHITREQGGYTEEFADYFSEKREEILDFKENRKKTMVENLAQGSFVKKPNVYHNAVNQDTSVVLYGINKWGNDNKVDAIIHVHFNDYPRADKWTIGKYSGFEIYIPDAQFVNFKGSADLAVSVMTELSKKYKVSDYPPEKGGLTTDQNLIAIGSNNSLDASVRSMLIEFGYIYEKKFRQKSTREQAYKNMADLTVKGIKSYFFPKK